jgi:hypothetical protein
MIGTVQNNLQWHVSASKVYSKEDYYIWSYIHLSWCLKMQLQIIFNSMTYWHQYGRPYEEEITQITTNACSIYLDDNEHILWTSCMHGFVHLLGTQD